MGDELLLLLVLLLVLWLIRVVRRVQGEGRVDLRGTRRGHVGLWNAVFLVVHGHDEVELVGGAEVVLRITWSRSEDHLDYGGRGGLTKYEI